MTHAEQWLQMLEKGCAAQSSAALHMIIDQAAAQQPLLPSVRSVEPPLAWASLFAQLPEAEAQHLAPLLVRIDLKEPLQRQWLFGLMQACDGRSQLLAVLSQWPFEALAEHLGRCLEARHGGVTGLLRYHDPRLFPLLFSHVLEAEQQQHWLCPALFWSWLDRDGRCQVLAGSAGEPGDAAVLEPIELSDDQLDTLCCASDVTVAMDEFAAACRPDASPEQSFQDCYQAMLDAGRAGLWLDAQRHAFVLERLRNG